jgi:GNAT superfamily N-acetyltransferase
LPVAVRPYQPADHAACRGLWAELTEHHRELYTDPTIGGEDPGAGLDAYLERSDLAGAWVAVVEDRVVGLAGLLVAGDRGEVEPVVVTARHRSQRIGRALLNRAVAEARERALVYVKARPVARNARALAFFHEAGFQTLGHVDLQLELADRNREWREGIDLHGRAYRY